MPGIVARRRAMSSLRCKAARARSRLGGPDARRSLPARPRAGTVGIAGRTKFSGEISFRRLRARRAVMAKPVRPGTGTPHGKSKALLPDNQNGTRFAEPVRASSPKSTASTGRTEDCTRPTRQISKLRLHQGSHPQKTVRFRPAILAIMGLISASPSDLANHVVEKANTTEIRPRLVARSKSPLGKCHRVVTDARRRPMDANSMVATETWINVS